MSTPISFSKQNMVQKRPFLNYRFNKLVITCFLWSFIFPFSFNTLSWSSPGSCASIYLVSSSLSHNICLLAQLSHSPCRVLISCILFFHTDLSTDDLAKVAFWIYPVFEASLKGLETDFFYRIWVVRPEFEPGEPVVSFCLDYPTWLVRHERPYQ